MELLLIFIGFIICLLLIYMVVHLIDYLINLWSIDAHNEINDYMKAKYGDDWVNFGK